MARLLFCNCSVNPAIAVKIMFVPFLRPAGSKPAELERPQNFTLKF